MRRFSGAALAALTLAIAGCSVMDGPPPAPTEPGEPVAATQPVMYVGELGQPIEVGPLAATVLGAAPWPEMEQTLGPEVSGLSVQVRLQSPRETLRLDAADFQLVDAVSGARYAAGARPSSPDLSFPVQVGPQPVEGTISFSPPKTGTYALRIAVNPSLSASVELGRIRSGELSERGKPSPTDAPAAPAATSAAEVAGCVRLVDGRWNPVGDDDRAPALDREYVEIRSTCDAATAMAGWELMDKWRENVFTFPAGFTLAPGASVRVYSGRGTPSAGRLYFGRTSVQVWGNKAPETAYLKDAGGALVSTYSPY